MRPPRHRDAEPSPGRARRHAAEPKGRRTRRTPAAFARSGGCRSPGTLSRGQNRRTGLRPGRDRPARRGTGEHTAIPMQEPPMKGSLPIGRIGGPADRSRTGSNGTSVTRKLPVATALHHRHPISKRGKRRSWLHHPSRPRAAARLPNAGSLPALRLPPTQSNIPPASRLHPAVAVRTVGVDPNG